MSHRPVGESEREGRSVERRESVERVCCARNLPFSMVGVGDSEAGRR
jgi:hypothetical protein